MFNNENQYLNLIKNILTNGIIRKNRTDVDTISEFGCKMIFDLSGNKIPLLTTKKMNFRAIVEELLWFISGSTNTKILSDKGIKIWDANSSKKFLNLRNLDYEEGDIGPGYGFQWRHSGDKYVNMYTKYNGVDQLKNCIDLIKNDPYSRRIIISAWNPSDIDKMALPPCHCLVQFYVNGNELYSQMYQRSGDMGLGIPFNIASYALLTHLIAKETNLQATKFIHIIGDAHIYLNHKNLLEEQLTREPLSEPYINIKNFTNIFNVKYDDIVLFNYKYHKSITMPFVL